MYTTTILKHTAKNTCDKTETRTKRRHRQFCTSSPLHITDIILRNNTEKYLTFNLWIQLCQTNQNNEDKSTK